jgi:tetratricopeptide (TPR) repeat protein
LILAKMREIQALESGGGVIDPEAAVVTPPGGNDLAANSATDALDLDEIEEVGADDFEEDVDDDRPAGGGKRKPTVMLEKPVDEGDAETHYDLGLAYKEMGLLDEAVKAFEKVLRAPGREVQCRLMLGMCQREQGNPNEAIHQFKQGLHANASDRERLSLYYEIGITYEAMGDDGEALYYFDAVVKREPSFADTAQRADLLRRRGGMAATGSGEDL